MRQAYFAYWMATGTVNRVLEQGDRRREAARARRERDRARVVEMLEEAGIQDQFDIDWATGMGVQIR